MLAILGTSAGLGGFVLVFLGVVINGYESYAGDVPAQVVRPYRRAGALLLAAFALSLVATGLCLIWLVAGGPKDFYPLTIAIFAVQVLVALAAAAWVTRMVLWR